MTQVVHHFLLRHHVTGAVDFRLANNVFVGQVTEHRQRARSVRVDVSYGALNRPIADGGRSMTVDIDPGPAQRRRGSIGNIFLMIQPVDDLISPIQSLANFLELLTCENCQFNSWAFQNSVLRLSSKCHLVEDLQRNLVKDLKRIKLKLRRRS